MKEWPTESTSYMLSTICTNGVEKSKIFKAQNYKEAKKKAKKLATKNALWWMKDLGIGEGDLDFHLYQLVEDSFLKRQSFCLEYIPEKNIYKKVFTTEHHLSLVDSI